MKIINLLFVFFLITNFGSAEMPKVRSQELTRSEQNSSYKNKIMYEVFIRSFFDSNKDGIGDIKGLNEKLPYLKNLGIEGIWMLPISPSPSYHKYDVTDYYSIDSVYGNKLDWFSLVETANALDIKLIIDVVLNHCSSQHPWFLNAKKSATSKYRNYFVWKKAKDIDSEPEHWYFPKDEKGNPIGDEKYYAFFWSEMPDLNFDNLQVREEAIKIGKYWLTEMKADGFRLDAAQHIFPEGQEEKNHLWWREFRKAMDETKDDFYMVGEIANKNEKIAPYLVKGLNSAFNFDLASDIISTTLSGVNNGIIDDLIKIRNLYLSTSSSFLDATFITNHDQDRILSDLNGDVNKAKMAAALLLTLPGSPYIYYGEEIGMLGKKPDEMIREPFMWSSESNYVGQTNWEVSVNSTLQSVIPLDQQMNDSLSIYSLYKNLIALRKSTAALNGDTLINVKTEDEHIVAYKRSNGVESVLVVCNMGKDEVNSKIQLDGLTMQKIYGTNRCSINMNQLNIAGYSFAVFKIQ